MKKTLIISGAIALVAGGVLVIGMTSWKNSRGAIAHPDSDRNRRSRRRIKPKDESLECAKDRFVVRKFIKEAAELFEEGTDVEMDYHSSRKPVVKQVLDGDVDFGCLARRVTDVEKLKGLNDKVIGWQAYAVVINARNPTRKLSIDELKGILTGKIERWDEIAKLREEAMRKARNSVRRGAPDEDESSEKPPVENVVDLDHRRITVLLPSRGSTMYQALDDNILWGKPARCRSKPASSSYLTMKILSRSCYSIGFATASVVDPDNEDIAVVKIQDAMPVMQDVSGNKYPIRVPITIVTKDRPEDNLKDFIDFCLTPTCQALMDKHYFRLRAPRRRRRRR